MKTEREIDMISRFKSGATYQDIANEYSLSRERVRQILSRNKIFKNHGGGCYRTKIKVGYKNQLKEIEREKKIIENYGCSLWQYDFIMMGVAWGQGTLACKYDRQKRSAAERGVEFKLSFWDWNTIWENSGQIHNMGRNRGQYVMARNKDMGPYSINNVSIKTTTENITEGYINRGISLKTKEQKRYNLLIWGREYRNKNRDKIRARGREWWRKNKSKASKIKNK